MSIYNPFPLFKGLWTVLKTAFEKPVTTQYPYVKREMVNRFKGRHHLRRYENGLEKCIGCALCAAACPADAIFVEASENSDAVRFSPGERYASTYEINMLRCIYCGYCEDACPTQAIELGHDYEQAFTNKADAIYTRERLLDPVPESGKATPQQVSPDVFTRSIPDMKNPD